MNTPTRPDFTKKMAPSTFTNHWYGAVVANASLDTLYRILDEAFAAGTLSVLQSKKIEASLDGYK
jgi:hypothetical protein